MSVEIYLGYPPEHIKNWIINYMNDINSDVSNNELIYEVDYNTISTKLSLDTYIQVDLNKTVESDENEFNDIVFDENDTGIDSETIEKLNQQINNYTSFIESITIN